MNRTRASVKGIVRRLWHMDWSDRVLVIRAFVGLPTVAIALRLTSLAKVRRWLDRKSPRRTASTQPVQYVADLVGRVARRHPYDANCLERSLTLRWLLSRAGIDSDLRLGVRPGANGAPPDFHAWIEVDGEVVNDRPDIATEFMPFHGGPGEVGNLV